MTQVRKHILGFIIASLACAGLAMPASASTAFEPSSQSFVVMPASQPSLAVTQYAQSSISASKAKSIARRAVPGAEVVDISRKGNRYKVRMIRKDGRVVDIVIDATSGRVLK
jgi:uncharacterized membrane protein YkoI